MMISPPCMTHNIKESIISFYFIFGFIVSLPFDMTQTSVLQMRCWFETSILSRGHRYVDAIAMKTGMRDNKTVLVG